MLLQVSKERGLEFRVRWWVCYLPTIEYIGATIGKGIAIFPKMIKGSVTPSAAGMSPTSSGMEDGGDTNSPLFGSSSPFKGKLAEWIRSKAGCMGLQGSAFAPEPPFYSCSGVLSLSGFYYGGKTLHKVCMAPIMALTGARTRHRARPRAVFNDISPREILSSSTSSILSGSSTSPLQKYSNEIRPKMMGNDDDAGVDIKMKV